MAPKFVAAHMLINEKVDDQKSWDDLPDMYKTIHFDALDVLYISPFIVDQKTFKFKLGTVEGGQSLQARFDALIQLARGINPDLKIVAMQWYSTGIDDSGLQFLETKVNPSVKPEDTTDTRISTYTASVADFLTSSKNVKWGSVSGHIDGWDVDYENPSKILETPKILDQLHSKLGSQFQVSITPAGADNLGNPADKVSQHIQYVNMQNYSGGTSLKAQWYLENIPDLKQEQLVYGITSEESVRNEMSILVKSYDINHPNDFAFKIKESKARFLSLADDINTKYAGVMLWRLNSDVHVFENYFQTWIYNKINPTKKLRDTVLSDEVMFNGWIINSGRDMNGKAVTDPSKWAQVVHDRYGNANVWSSS